MDHDKNPLQLKTKEVQGAHGSVVSEAPQAVLQPFTQESPESSQNGVHTYTYVYIYTYICIL